MRPARGYAGSQRATASSSRSTPSSARSRTRAATKVFVTLPALNSVSAVTGAPPRETRPLAPAHRPFPLTITAADAPGIAYLSRCSSSVRWSRAPRSRSKLVAVPELPRFGVPESAPPQPTTTAASTATSARRTIGGYAASVTERSRSRRCATATPAANRSSSSRRSSSRRVLLGHAPRNTERPRILDELAHLLGVQRVEADVRPVVAHVAGPRQRELLRLRVDERLPELLREGEAHRRPVAREREPDDPADAELDPPTDERLAAARERAREGPDLVHRDHGQFESTEGAVGALARDDLRSPAPARAGGL